MYYVCEYADDRPLQFLAGPYETEDVALAASAAYEADHPEFGMKTRVWTCRAGRDDLCRRYDGAEVAGPGAASPFPPQSQPASSPVPSLLIQAVSNVPDTAQ
jgi:hypothetical protein